MSLGWKGHQPSLNGPHNAVKPSFPRWQCPTCRSLLHKFSEVCTNPTGVGSRRSSEKTFGTVSEAVSGSLRNCDCGAKDVPSALGGVDAALSSSHGPLPELACLPVWGTRAGILAWNPRTPVRRSDLNSDNATTDEFRSSDSVHWQVVLRVALAVTSS